MSLILIANPGSASRKYALFRNQKNVANLHFETVDDKIVCNFQVNDERFQEPLGIRDFSGTADYIKTMFIRVGAMKDEEKIDAIGLRIVAPSSFFLINHKITPTIYDKLTELERLAPLHINIALREFSILSEHFKNVPIFGISDSAFHLTKPDFAWNYGISIDDADKFEIKRYGYHGLAAASVVRKLKNQDKLANRTIIVHLGSGCSVTALYGGKSLDNTMGYSPLEGPLMATRSGSIDYSATRALQTQKNLSNDEMENYLNKNSGLVGLGGSSDVRQLIDSQKQGDNIARLALKTYVYNIQKAISQMMVPLGGVDAIVFTGTIGERSSFIRKEVIERLRFLDFSIDAKVNRYCKEPDDVKNISQLAISRPIYVVHADEASEIYLQVKNLMGKV